ncbi:MAG: type II toxin-antitoxin system prevent-host-death family antitoxin [Anaerolineales bacterium]|nr:type II toxin-antitoxin system prevent-host-death family antitoxin [Anaerolineales bacterium]
MTVKIVPISEFRQNIKLILSQLEATGEPYFITQYSYPKAVLVRYEDYNNLVDQAEQSNLIVRRSDISAGEPILSGTRITVRAIIEQIQAGQTVKDILSAYPHLDEAQVYSALAYYHSHRAELDLLLEEASLANILAENALHVKQIADGVTEAHDEKGKW